MAHANNAFHCDVDAEPLKRYREGWGAYATVWLAKDLLLCRHTALKILVSERSQNDHEARILNRLSQGPADHSGKKHVVQLLDYFHHEGPNGNHPCLVLELLGPSVVSETESYTSNRLPGNISWEASKQVVQGLEYIHARGIAHGDLHPGNVIFANTTQQGLSDTNLITSLGKPRTGDVMATYGASLTPWVPRYLVCPTSLPSPAREVGDALVKIVDFGEASLQGQRSKIHSPLVFRAPETIFASQQDLQTDVWSLACTIFELIVEYPPFDNLMPNRDDLIREWVSMLGDLPQEWEAYIPPPQANEDLEIGRCSLAEWLHKMYFDDEKDLYFTKAEIQAAGDLLQLMMQYRPSNRPRASQLLDHRWFQNSRFEGLDVQSFEASGS